MTSDAEHEMYGRMPVWRLFLKCSIPGMISGLVWAFCSIMDGIFVGNYLGSDALAAVNLAWPIMTVFMAVSDMVAAGSSVRISMHLGNGDTDMARRVFTGSVKLIVAISVGFLLIGVFLGGPIVTFMGAEGEVADMAAQYIAVFSLFAPVGLLFFATDNYLRICGAVNLSMWINVGVAVLNVALLAVLIGWLGCGTWASAFATSFSVALGSVDSNMFGVARAVVFIEVGAGEHELLADGYGECAGLETGLHGYDAGVQMETIEYCIGHSMKRNRPICNYIRVMQSHADVALRRIFDRLL